jgi:hypothetical protein
MGLVYKASVSPICLRKGRTSLNKQMANSSFSGLKRQMGQP